MELKQLMLPEKGEEIAIMKTNFGDIYIKLFPEVAPKAVENFIIHSKNGYYNGITFHRIIKDFMIQGGDPDGTGMGGKSIWNMPFEDEFNENYRNFKGALSMANAGSNTNGSQFFIVQKSDIDKNHLEQMKQLGESSGYSDEVIKAYEEIGGTCWLDFRHTVFGQVFKGLDIVDKIAEVDVDMRDMPYEPVVIEEINIVEY